MKKFLYFLLISITTFSTFTYADLSIPAEEQSAEDLISLAKTRINTFHNFYAPSPKILSLINSIEALIKQGKTNPNLRSELTKKIEMLNKAMTINAENKDAVLQWEGPFPNNII